MILPFSENYLLMQQIKIKKMRGKSRKKEMEVVGEEKFFLYSLRFLSWGLQIKRTEDILTGEKAYNFVFYLFKCTRNSQNSSENPKRFSTWGLINHFRKKQ